MNRVLVAHPSAAVLVEARDELVSAGYDVITATSGLEAYRLLRANGLAVAVLGDFRDDELNARGIIWGIVRDRRKLPPTVLLSGLPKHHLDELFPDGAPTTLALPLDGHTLAGVVAKAAKR